MPEGYVVLRKEKNSILVGMTFAHFNKEVKSEITVDNQVYVAGYIEPIPLELAEHYCSVRRYTLKDS